MTSSLLTGEALALWMLAEMQERMATQARPLIVSVAGAQGSGKSTLSKQVAAKLEVNGQPGLVLSLDDFYLTKSERQALASRVHPLCGTRGPPGTHDTLGLIEAISTLAEGGSCNLSLPQFAKAVDDRVGEPRVWSGQATWVIVEGWCLGISATEESPDELNAQIYQSQRTEIWKDWVERTIAGEWKRLDSLFDWSIYLKIPSFESIVDARWLQEETLRRETGQSQFKTRDEVRSFVALYEPWTLRMAQAKAPWVDQIFEVENGYAYRRVD